MKQAKKRGFYVFFTVILNSFLLLYVLGADCAVKKAPPGKTETGYLENISFEKLPGKERVRFSVSRETEVSAEASQRNQVVVRMNDIFVPRGLQRPIKETTLFNVLGVTMRQESEKGGLRAVATIDLKEKTPFSLTRDGLHVLIDFNVASLVSAAEIKAPADTPQKPRTAAISSLKQQAKNGEKITQGPKILLDVQDADIKSVFRLLAEQGKVSIVSGDDVKGNVTVHLKDVTWLEALDTILEIKGFVRKIDGNVIKVMTMEKIDTEPLVTRVRKIYYADAKKLTENIVALLPKGKDGKVSKGSVRVDEHSNSLIIQASRQDMNRLYPVIEKIDTPTPQILIKANIVETTKETARSLGIQWGGMYGHTIGSQGLYVTPGGTGGSTVPPGSAFSGGYSPAYGSRGISGQGFGVNFPATGLTAVASGTLGLMYGTIGENILEVQLSALQKDGKLRILSSPSITTLDNHKAFTENGEKVPYNKLDDKGNTVTEFADAVLRLEIKPNVIDEKKLKMEIIVKKDEVDTTRSVGGNPYIIKKQTETNLIVGDGETIVISGLTKQTKKDSVSGIPWLKDVPILGWLFKGEGKSETMEEVLIFITPTILKAPEISGIQGGF